jgi:hypothetical protein
MSEGDPENIDDPTMAARSGPFILFCLDNYDDGSNRNRTISPAYLTRTPISVVWFDRTLKLCVTNLGAVASDLIKIDHQFRTCIEPTHTVAEGFSHEHLGEIDSQLFDSALRLDFLPAAENRRGANLIIEIPLPTLPKNIVTLYFRARESTLWDKPIPKAEWDFATDRMVVESTKRYVTMF